MFQFMQKQPRPQWGSANSLKVQTHLQLNTPGDRYEQEADAIADRLVGPSGQDRSSGQAGESGGQAAVPPVITDLLKTSGQPLDPSTREIMETRFGHDFSRVRVHNDAQASVASSAIQAQAYTAGHHLVFGQGQYSPHTRAGQHLIAHELAHVTQQAQGGTPAIQRVITRFGPTTNAPANWGAQVAAATTSAAKAALLQSVVGMTVSDATTASAGDASPTPAHLVEYSATNQQVNYDENLNSKTAPASTGGRSLSDDVGYTLHSGSRYYVILSSRAVDAGDYYLPITTLSHEFDHVRQGIAGSTLPRNESELDAWTSSFIRDFHRTYRLADNGTTCYVDNIPTWTPLLDYYRRTGVSAAQQTASVNRIKAYYTATVSPHAGHLAAFRYWIYRSMKNTSATPNIADRLNTELSLGISASASAASMRQFPCGSAQTLTYSAPTVDRPTFPSATPPASP